jgi:hypothetical protein
MVCTGGRARGGIKIGLVIIHVMKELKTTTTTKLAGPTFSSSLPPMWPRTHKHTYPDYEPPREQPDEPGKADDAEPREVDLGHQREYCQPHKNGSGNDKRLKHYRAGPTALQRGAHHPQRVGLDERPHPEQHHVGGVLVPVAVWKVGHGWGWMKVN